ncbi:MAG: NlpC/P60 family protein [Planctomycetota bacterium]
MRGVNPIVMRLTAGLCLALCVPACQSPSERASTDEAPRLAASPPDQTPATRPDAQWDPVPDAAKELLPGELPGTGVPGVIRVIEFTPAMFSAVVAESPHLAPVLQSSLDWLGTPYVWGGKTPIDGLDCSGYTWRAFHDHGLGYDRYQSTRRMSVHQAGNGLTRVSTKLQDARPGDLLVYGYFDNPNSQEGWHGHVVILIDPDGATTGVPGLVVGSHGGTVDRLAFVVAKGFDEGYFRRPKSRLRAVLRPDAFAE